MTDTDEVREHLFCPSAPPEWSGATLIGIVGGTASQPRVTPLEKGIPVTSEVLALAGPVLPTEVFGLQPRAFVGRASTLRTIAAIWRRRSFRFSPRLPLTYLSARFARTVDGSARKGWKRAEDVRRWLLTMPILPPECVRLLIPITRYPNEASF